MATSSLPVCALGAPMANKAAMTNDARHHIVVVGGGAGGLELATRLGDKLGRRKVADVTLIDKSRAHLWKPLLHEIAAGTMDFAVHEIDYLAQAHWHGFRYRIGELIGLDRERREVALAPYLDEEGRQVDDSQVDLEGSERREGRKPRGMRARNHFGTRRRTERKERLLTLQKNQTIHYSFGE